jgi:hypothetical protein
MRIGDLDSPIVDHSKSGMQKLTALEEITQLDPQKEHQRIVKPTELTLVFVGTAALCAV